MQTAEYTRETATADDGGDKEESDSTHSSVIRFSVRAIDAAHAAAADAAMDEASTCIEEDRRAVRPATITPPPGIDSRAASPGSASIHRRAAAGLLDDYPTCGGDNEASVHFSSPGDGGGGGGGRLRHRYHKRDQRAGNGIASVELPSPYDGDALVDLIDNPEYIDTLEGRLPLAAAAKMIARDSVVAAIGSGVVTPESKRRECHSKLLALSFAITLATSAFFACYHVQAADSAVAGGGRQLRMQAAMALGASAWLGALCASPLMHATGSPRAVVVAGTVMSLAYAVASFFPFGTGDAGTVAAATLLPAAIVQGFGGGLLLAAEGIYAVGVAGTYSAVFAQPLPEVYALFNGIACTIAQAARVLGGVVSLVVLDRRALVAENSRPLLLYGERTAEGACGPLYNWTAADLNQSLAAAASAGEDATFTGMLQRGLVQERLTILAVLAMFVLSGAHIAAMHLRGSDVTYLAASRTACHSMRGLAGALLDVRLLLLLPFAIAFALGSTVVGGNFTEAFMACRMGANGVVYSLLLGALLGLAGAWLGVLMAEKTGKMLVVCTGTALAFASLLMLQFWVPWMSNSIALMLATSSMWFLAEGMLLTQLNGMLGILFKEQLPSACAAVLLFYGAAYALGSLTMAQLWGSLAVKLYFTMGSFVLALACYVGLEVMTRRSVI